MPFRAFSFVRRAMLVGAMAGACLLGAAPASADALWWKISGTFSDGATLTGYLHTNIYGVVDNYDLETSPDAPFAGFDFVAATAANHYISGGASSSTSFTAFGTTYNGDQLHLDFSQSIFSGSAYNALLSTSFECQNSYSCPSGGDVRFLISGFAATPEPATWMILLFGFGALGIVLRRRKNVPTAAMA